MFITRNHQNHQIKLLVTAREIEANRKEEKKNWKKMSEVEKSATEVDNNVEEVEVRSETPCDCDGNCYLCTRLRKQGLIVSPQKVKVQIRRGRSLGKVRAINIQQEKIK